MITRVPLLAALTLAVGIANAQPPSIPDMILTADGDRPLWFRGKLALGRDGELDLHPESRGKPAPGSCESPERSGGRRVPAKSSGRSAGAQAAFRQLPNSDCSAIIGEMIGDYEWDPTYVPPRPGHLIEWLASRALGVYEGRIVEVEEGFGGGRAGSLARVRVSRVLKANESIDSHGDLFVFHEYARFAVAGYYFCVGQRPLSVGDRVVLLVNVQPQDGGRRLIFAPETFFFEHEGRLSLPLMRRHQIEVESGGSLDEIAAIAAKGLQVQK